MAIKNLIPESITVHNKYILSEIDKKLIKCLKININNSVSFIKLF